MLEIRQLSNGFTCLYNGYSILIFDKGGVFFAFIRNYIYYYNYTEKPFKFLHQEIFNQFGCIKSVECDDLENKITIEWEL